MDGAGKFNAERGYSARSEKANYYPYKSNPIAPQAPGGKGITYTPRLDGGRETEILVFNSRGQK